MASAGDAVSPAARPTGAPSPWLHGPTSDLLLGAGVLYFGVFLLLALMGPQIRAAQASYLLPLLVLLVSMPHYGATLVRVYESRRDRHTYTFFSLWISLLLFALFVTGVHSAAVGAVLLTVYLTWSPWHYTGQNYGIGVMFLRRRGIAIDGLAKRCLYWSFLLSYVLVLITFHGSVGGAISYDRFSFAETTVRFLPLGIPRAIGEPLFALAAVGYVGCTVVATVLLLRRARFRELVPTLLLVISQALWFSLPFASHFLQVRTGVEPIDAQVRIRDYVLWVALAHSAQYLWVTSYYARATSQWHGGLAYAAKVAAAGIAIWTLPVIVFAPGLLGRVPYDAGLSLVLASVVNIHHFVLDGAIWKLRQTRIGEVLIRSGQAESEQTPRRGLRALAWTTCAAGLAAAVFVFVEIDVRLGRAYARQDWQAAAAILDRASWLGRDSAKERRKVARQLFAAQQPELAIAHYRRAIELDPNASYLGELAFIQNQVGEVDMAVETYRRGRELEPDHPGLLLHLARAELAVGRPEAAVRTLERLSELKPDFAEGQSALAEARAAAASGS